MPDGRRSFTVLDDNGDVVDSLRNWIVHLEQTNASPNTIRGYARHVVDLANYLSMHGADLAQITERGSRVAEVSQRFGVIQHSLYVWKRQLTKVVSGDANKDVEIRQLKRELARETEERDILQKATAYFARDAK